MMTKRTVIGIRTHKWDEEVSNFYQMMLNVFKPEDVYIVCDEITQEISLPEELNKISINKRFLKEIKVKDSYAYFNIGWLCGDYCYYALRESIAADYYWLIESDIYFTPTVLKKFFKTMSKLNSDAITINFQLSNESWYWNKTMKYLSEKTYRMLFGISRLSYMAIGSCLKERQYVTQEISNLKVPDNLYPNDEALVATALMKYGHSIAKIEDYVPKGTFDNFSAESFRSSYLSINNELNNSSKIIHPLVSENRLVSDIYGSIDNYIVENMSHRDISSYRLISSQIPSIMYKIEKNILNSLQKTVLPQLILHSVFDKFATVLLDDLECRAYVWENRVVVLDLEHFGKCYTIDVFVEHSVVTCQIFSRNNSAEFELYVTSNYPEYHLKDGKLTFKEMPLIEYEDFQLDLAIAFLVDLIDKLI